MSYIKKMSKKKKNLKFITKYLKGSTNSLEGPQGQINMTVSRCLFPKSNQGKEKRRYSLLVF